MELSGKRILLTGGDGFLGAKAEEISAGAVHHIHIAEVRISMGCLRSHRLNTLNSTMPTSMGS